MSAPLLVAMCILVSQGVLPDYYGPSKVLESLRGIGIFALRSWEVGEGQMHLVLEKILA